MTSGKPELRVRDDFNRVAAAAVDRLGGGAAATHVHMPRAVCTFTFLQVAETYDECIENTVIKLGYGILSGGLTAMILFRASLCTPPALLRRMSTQ